MALDGMYLTLIILIFSPLLLMFLHMAAVHVIKRFSVNISSQRSLILTELLFNLPLLVIIYLWVNSFSLIIEYKTGTTNMDTIATSIPPNAGIAIGIIMSDPRPFEVSTGNRARTVVAVVMSIGRTRFKPA